MGKINFTKEHREELIKMIGNSILNNEIISGPFGQTYTAHDLVNDLSVQSLRTLSTTLSKKKASLSVTDEWSENVNVEQINEIDSQLKFISLIIGFKLKRAEVADMMAEREKLSKQLEELVNAQKTPDDLISEIRNKIASLNENM